MIVEAIEAAGGKLLAPPNPREAPFEIAFTAADGERFDLVCYAFLANKYGQKGRPADEHRFQVKYGSEFHRYHELFIDPTRARITMMLGVHLEERLFIAVDPAMHNPTRFSSSVELKADELREASRLGWHGWERERSNTRRKIARPRESYQTEVVLAFTPDRLVDFVRFEKMATGLDPGERLLLVEKMRDASRAPLDQQIRAQFGLSVDEFFGIFKGAFRLEAAVRGRVAEHHLGNHLRQIGGISQVESIDRDGQPDFHVLYRGQPLKIECKNVLRKLTRHGPRVDFQKTRASKGDPCSRYYEQKAFDVLAACLHPVTEKWEFRFCDTARLAPHSKCPGRLSDKVIVAGDLWTSSLGELLDRRSGPA